jgi:glucose/arabinose dehydrogenase
MFPRSHPPVPLRLLGLKVVLLLVLTACSNGSPTDTPVAPATATPPPAVTSPSSTTESEPTATTSPPGTPTAPMTPAATATLAGATATAPAADHDPTTLSVALVPVANGFVQPLFVTHAGDGSGRLFVVEKGGTIRLLDGTLVLDISDRVNASGSEQGLLGLAFDPGPTTDVFYVNYTDAQGDTVISRFRMTGDVADAGSEEVILTQEQPAGNHNGGMLAFGPDGYLYIGMGDGGGAYDRFGTAQDLSSLLGKLLRIDVDGGDPYGIPPDNPFVDQDGVRPEIWAFGLRNPWRFAFDRETGDLYIADVGQATTEWVHFQPGASSGGENYSWPIYEGTVCHLTEQCDDQNLILPIAEYGREGGCAIIGGYVYRGEQFPSMHGFYLFSDLCSGLVWATARDASGAWHTAQVGEVDARVSSFGEDEAGELYLADLASGIIYHLTTAE